MDEADSSALAVILAGKAQSSLSCRAGGQFHHSQFFCLAGTESVRGALCFPAVQNIFTLQKAQSVGRGEIEAIRKQMLAEVGLLWSLA